MQFRSVFFSSAFTVDPCYVTVANDYGILPTINFSAHIQVNLLTLFTLILLHIIVKYNCSEKSLYKFKIIFKEKH